jgi:hypothetical protein
VTRVIVSLATSLDECIAGQLGTPSIELERSQVIEAPGVTQLRFRVLGPQS